MRRVLRSLPWRDILLSSFAGVLAWICAAHLLGHSQPIFAAIGAIICLAPGIPSHRRQAIGMTAGVLVGIAVGEAALALVPGPGPVEALARLGGSSVLAMLLAAGFGFGPVMVIQSAASAIIVVAYGDPAVGLQRITDVAVGAATGLLFSQVLATPDPVPRVETAARLLAAELGEGLRLCAEAMGRGDASLAAEGGRRLADAQAALVALEEALGFAHRVSLWTVRGRLTRDRIGRTLARYDRRAVALLGCAVAFATALRAALGDGPAPDGLLAAARAIADRLVSGAPAPGAASGLAPVAGVWGDVAAHLRTLEAANAALAVAEGAATAATSPPDARGLLR